MPEPVCSQKHLPRRGAAKRWANCTLIALPFVAIAAFLLIWLCLTLMREHRENRMVAEIEALGGEIEWGSEGGSLAKIPHPDKSTIAQIPLYRSSFGLELGWRGSSNALTDTELEGLSRLKGLYRLHLINTGISDEGLRHLVDLPHLYFLWIIGGNVSDQGLRHVAAMPFLKSLVLENLNITDEGLRQLSGAQLTDLELVDLHITDEGLRHLANMKLQTLGVRNANIKGPGLRYLADIAGLQDVELSHQRITGPGLEHLKHLAKQGSFGLILLDHNPIDDDGLQNLSQWKAVRALSLCSTQIRGPGLRHLPNTEYLRLENTPIDDEGLEHLPTMPRLSHLYLAGTKVTSRGVAKLQKRMPRLRRVYGVER